MKKNQTIQYQGQEATVLQIDPSGRRLLIRTADGRTLPVSNSEIANSVPVDTKLASEDSESVLVQRISNWRPQDYTEFYAILKEADHAGFLDHDSLSLVLETSPSFVRNCIAGMTRPANSRCVEILSAVRTQILSYEAEEPEQPKKEIPSHTELVVIDVQGESYSVELTELAGLWTGYVPTLKLTASGEHKLDVILDIKGLILRGDLPEVDSPPSDPLPVALVPESSLAPVEVPSPEQDQEPEPDFIEDSEVEYLEPEIQSPPPKISAPVVHDAFDLLDRLSRLSTF